jgi:hypothetical protein
MVEVDRNRTARDSSGRGSRVVEGEFMCPFAFPEPSTVESWALKGVDRDV